MMRKTVLVLFGTRPEAIKMAPVIAALRKRSGRIRVRVAVTGQHRQMLEQVLQVFRIRPHIDLKLMRRGQPLAGLTARALLGLDRVLLKERPDLVLVQGDTTTAMVGALASFYRKIPVGHVEAGLRTFDLQHPFPEEANRRVISAVARLHFAPTGLSVRHLLKERIPREWIFLTGNTVIDALRTAVRAAAGRRFPELADAEHWKGKVVLITAHRRENWGAPLQRICEAIRGLAARYPAVLFVYPVHANPSVLEPVRRSLSGLSNVRLLPPLSYLPLVALMERCHLVLTDSGGIQEEAPGLGKPVLVLREKTERPEAVHAGTVRLVGMDPGKIRHETIRLMEHPGAYRRMSRAVNPYGDGQAAPRIAAAVLYFFGFRGTPPGPFRAGR